MSAQTRKFPVAFTPQHQLEDAEQEYVEAIYRFRRAEGKAELITPVPAGNDSSAW